MSPILKRFSQDESIKEKPSPQYPQYRYERGYALYHGQKYEGDFGTIWDHDEIVIEYINKAIPIEIS